MIRLYHLRAECKLSGVLGKCSHDPIESSLVLIKGVEVAKIDEMRVYDTFKKCIFITSFKISTRIILIVLLISRKFRAWTTFITKSFLLNIVIDRQMNLSYVLFNQGCLPMFFYNYMKLLGF